MIHKEIQNTGFDTCKVCITSSPEKEDHGIGTCRHECPTSELSNSHELKILEKDLASTGIDAAIGEDTRREDDRSDTSLVEELFSSLNKETLYL